MRLRNKKLVTDIIRRQNCSRAELAKFTGLTRAGISLIIDSLLADGYIFEGEKKASAVGRNPTKLYINPHAAYAVGVNISRHGFSVGIVGFDGNIVMREDCGEKDLLPEETLSRIFAVIDTLLKNPPLGTFLGIGITMPGPLDAVEGRLLYIPNFPNWSNFSVTAAFKDRYKCNVRLENNSKALALAELYFGGINEQNFVEIVADSGLGTGIILNGRLFSGGAEFGHTTIKNEKKPCGCGNTDCAELYLSMSALRENLSLKAVGVGSWRDLVDAMLAGNAVCKKIAYEYIEDLSSFAVNIVNTFDVDAVVFAGDLTYRLEELKKIIVNKLKPRILKKDGCPEIYASGLPSGAEVISAALLLLTG